MCGRYVTSRRAGELAEAFGVDQLALTEDLAPDFNVAPTKPVPAVLTDVPPSGGPPVRQLRLLRWGLVPSWARDPSIGSRMINARVETAADRPAYRRAYRRRRCLLPADGYYEWVSVNTGQDSRPVRQPYFIQPRHGLLALAGLYERWRDPSRAEDDPASWLWTCTILTRPAEPSLAHLHHRMPLLVAARHFDAWLDPGTDGPGLAGLLAQSSPAPNSPAPLEFWPVTTAVNNVRNNGPELPRPLTGEAGPGNG